MKKERKILMRNPQDVSIPVLLSRLEALRHCKLEDRFVKGKQLELELEQKLENVLRVNGPSTEIEAILDEVRFIVQMAAEGKAFLARIAS